MSGKGIDQIPTVHLGVAAFQMEKRGIRTERGNLNREIEVTNQQSAAVEGAHFQAAKLAERGSGEHRAAHSCRGDTGYPSRREQTGKPGCYTAVNNLKAAAKMLNFLQENQIVDMDGLTDKIAGMFGEQREISAETHRQAIENP
ncbi:MAG: hypothetical protein ACLSH2_06715 [Oscillospiraceae bacterium]